MSFFDLNLPYVEATPSDKTNRIKLVTLAMEIGYSGVAYNRMINGVMSDRDRCSIAPLPLSSLLKLAPALASSVHFHRDLLGVTRSSPFRQYTRLTFCGDSPSMAQALNSGNPIIKSYDLVSIRPMNQSVFDLACEKLEVDLITIDFSKKLPFRLKMPMVKAAIQRGVFFEITYSNLITDIQARRQTISNAKLLVDWTRGKSLIISSAAHTVYELRGPLDVANLSFLLGLSTEQAKAALSKNCRTLITKALRKKQFFKEAIKVEIISSREQVDSNKPWPSDLFEWDPISSGEGDLSLDDLAESLAASREVAKTVKAIDFTSAVSNMPSNRFQIKDLISGDGDVSKLGDSVKKIASADAVELPISSESNQESLEIIDLSKAGQTPLCGVLSNYHTLSFQSSQEVSLPSDTKHAFVDVFQNGAAETTTEIGANFPYNLDTTVNLTETEVGNMQSHDSVKISDLHEIPNKDVTCQTSYTALDASSNEDSKVEMSNLSKYRELSAHNEEVGSLKCSVVDAASEMETFTSSKDGEFAAHNTEETSFKSDEIVTKGDPMDEDSNGVDMKNQRHTSSLFGDSSFQEDATGKGPFGERADEPVVLAEQICMQASDAMVRESSVSLVVNHEQLEVPVEDNKLEKADTGFHQVTFVKCASWKSKVKGKAPHQAFLFPHKLLLSPKLFKKAGKSKSKSERKISINSM